MSGKDGIGHIGLNGKDGRNADMTVDKGTPDLDGNEITRIKYTDERVPLMKWQPKMTA